MKNILLASTALFAFAGAAAAESHIGISFTGSAVLGYNDEDSGETDDNLDFYADLDVTIGLVAELNNGLTAAASIDLEDLASGQLSGEDDGGSGIAADSEIDFELSLTSATSGLFYGDTNFAAQNIWVPAGNMNADDFSEADGEEVIRGEVNYNGWSGAISYALTNNDGERNVDETLNQLSLAVTGDIGNFNVVAAYQDETDEAAGFSGGDFVDDEIFALSVSTTYAGANIRVGYASNETTNDDSIGVEVSYPFGPVTATGFYVSEDGAGVDDNYGLTLAYEEGPVSVTFDYESEDNVDTYGIEGAYDLENGLVIFAGYIDADGDDEEYYVGAEYDLGSGAELIVSYGEGDDSEDEVGVQGYQEGTTIELSFEF